MVDNVNKEADNPQDSLVDALESIKSLLAKSDSKLAAARESIAIASNQTATSTQDFNDQLEIPVLDDIISPTDIESATHAVSNISEQLSEKIDETLAAIPTLSPPEESTKSNNTSPQVILDYLDSLEKNLEKSLRNSLMKSVVTIELGLKKSLNSEIDKIREQIKKDHK